MNTKKLDQNGLVSIMIASVLMVIMALITLGFTRVVQNEQRQAIDDQLSRQAFYAAESGINIAASSTGFPGTRKEDCDVSGYNDGRIDGVNEDITFTCVLIDPTPTDIVFNNDSITTNKSKVVPIKPSSYPSEIIFEWRDSSMSGNSAPYETNCNSVLDFDIDAGTWNKIAPLQLDLLGVPNVAFNRDSLVNNQFGAIFYPCNSASGVTQVAYSDAVGSANVGKIIPVNCQQTGEYQCRIAITGVIANQREFYVRFNSIYNELNVRITAVDTIGNSILFAGAQAVVDSTGRANDVFRRLQARVPLYDTFSIPSGVIQTLNDICKLYEVNSTEIVDRCQT